MVSDQKQGAPADTADQQEASVSQSPSKKVMEYITPSKLKLNYSQNTSVSPEKDNQGNELFDKEYEPMYYAILEWVLNRQPTKDLQDHIMIVDHDDIVSKEAFQLLIEFYKKCNDNL